MQQTKTTEKPEPENESIFLIAYFYGCFELPEYTTSKFLLINSLVRKVICKTCKTFSVTQALINLSWFHLLPADIRIIKCL